MKKIPIKTIKKLIRLRNQLDAMSQISWSFSILNKMHPMSELSEGDAKELIESYEEFLSNLEKLLAEK